MRAAQGWMLSVLLLGLAHVATSQVFSCAAGSTDCDGAGAGATCCACAAGYFKTTLGTALCTRCEAGKYAQQIPSGVQIDYQESNLAPFGCTSCYDAIYDEVTTPENIENCRKLAKSTGWIAMGAKIGALSTTFLAMAFIKSSEFSSTSLTVMGEDPMKCPQLDAVFSNGAYWYYNDKTFGGAVGFAPRSRVWLCDVDFLDTQYCVDESNVRPDECSGSDASKCGYLLVGFRPHVCGIDLGVFPRVSIG
jgi:hypothetical protein